MYHASAFKHAHAISEVLILWISNIINQFCDIDKA